MNDQPNGSAEQRADLYHKLAEGAWNRLESHRRIEWRTFLALWATFGIGSGIVLSADAWVPGIVDIVVAFFVVLGILIGSWLWWLPYLSKSLYRDNWLSYYWETHVEKALGPGRPGLLLPPEVDGDSWPSAFDDDPNKVHGNSEGSERRIPTRWHTVQYVQFAVTCLFGLLFVLALMSKGCHASNSVGPPSKMTIEGGSLELDGTSKLKLGE